MPASKKMSLFLIFGLTSMLSTVMSSYADTPYTVTDAKALDPNSYQGYKVYRQWCARCHGTFGQGGTKAPNLAASLATISRQEYTRAVTFGKVNRMRKVTKNDQMPAWQRNPSVMDNINNIYSYLKARSDGAIGTVKPQLGK